MLPMAPAVTETVPRAGVPLTSSPVNGTQPV